MVSLRAFYILPRGLPRYRAKHMQEFAESLAENTSLLRVCFEFHFYYPLGGYKGQVTVDEQLKAKEETRCMYYPDVYKVRIPKISRLAEAGSPDSVFSAFQSCLICFRAS